MIFAPTVVAILAPSFGQPFSTIVNEDKLCVWGARTKSWLDKNEDGKWNNDEKPLSGVQFLLNGELRESSDENGEAWVTRLSWGDVQKDTCPSIFFEIVARPPPGYRLTTAERVTGTSEGTFLEYTFGFTDLPYVPTPTSLIPASQPSK
jgi:hypothetical protein